MNNGIKSPKTLNKPSYPSKKLHQMTDLNFLFCLIKAIYDYDQDIMTQYAGYETSYNQVF